MLDSRSTTTVILWSAVLFGAISVPAFAEFLYSIDTANDRLVKIDTTTCAITEVGPLGVDFFDVDGLVASRGVELIATRILDVPAGVASYEFCTVDSRTGAVSGCVVATPGFGGPWIAEALSRNPLTGTVYATFWNAAAPDGIHLGSVDMTNAGQPLTDLCVLLSSPCVDDIDDMTFDGTGNLFALDNSHLPNSCSPGTYPYAYYPIGLPGCSISGGCSEHCEPSWSLGPPVFLRDGSLISWAGLIGLPERYLVRLDPTTGAVLSMICQVPGTPAMSLLALPLTDCNENGIDDAIDIANCPPGVLTCSDCNANGIPDDCDIDSGTSLDCQPNGVPDECEVPPMCAICSDCNSNNVPDNCDLDCAHNGVPDNCECLAVVAAGPEAVVIAKNRYISFVPGNGCLRTAIRVTLADLPHPFDQVPPPSGFEGVKMWVGPPRAVSEIGGRSDGTPPTFSGAELQCSPHYDDWGPWGTLHVSSDAVVPRARYEVQLVHEGCDAGSEANYSPPLSIPTATKWCDVRDPFGVVNFQDVAALVDKFQDKPTAPIKARADLLANVPDRIVNFQEVSAAVGAFQGKPYPFAGPIGCP